MATFFISPTGNDSTGDGSQGNPWLTLSKAVSSSTTGDTILIDSDNGNFTWVSQTFSSSRTLGSYGTLGVTTLDAGAAVNVIFSFSGVFTVQNLKFSNNANTDDTFELSSNNAVVSFTSCQFTGLMVGANRGMFNNKSGFTGSQWSFQSCLFYLNQINPTSTTAIPGYLGDDVGGTTLYTLAFCTFFDTANTYALNMEGPVNRNNRIVAINSIFYQATAGVGWGSGGVLTNTTLTNCCVFGYNLPNGTNTNCITSDPLFVDAANGNFNLQPTSPCKFTGTPP